MTIIKVRAIIIKNNTIFLMKGSEKNFILPGGKQEDGETIQQTLYREIREETGVEAVIDKYIGMKEYISKMGKITLQFLFTLKNVQDFENINRNTCSHGFEWIECGFYSIDFLKQNNCDFPQDLEEIIKATKYDSVYKGFL